MFFARGGTQTQNGFSAREHVEQSATTRAIPAIVNVGLLAVVEACIVAAWAGVLVKSGWPRVRLRPSIYTQGLKRKNLHAVMIVRLSRRAENAPATFA